MSCWSRGPEGTLPARQGKAIYINYGKGLFSTLCIYNPRTGSGTNRPGYASVWHPTLSAVVVGVFFLSFLFSLIKTISMYPDRHSAGGVCALYSKGYVHNAYVIS